MIDQPTSRGFGLSQRLLGQQLDVIASGPSSHDSQPGANTRFSHVAMQVYQIQGKDIRRRPTHDRYRSTLLNGLILQQTS